MDEQLTQEIEQLFELVHKRGLDEVAITRPDVSISVVAMPRDMVAMAPVSTHAAPAAAQAAAVTPQGHEITSPLVGIFYRSPSPDAPAFVEVGDTVEVGQTIAIVEAMKVFNEITADVAGTVVAIPAENGKLVQTGQSLLVVDTEG